MAGIDLLFDNDHFKICEANSSPGFEGLESCCEGVNIPQELFHFLRIRLGKFSEIEHPHPHHPTPPHPKALQSQLTEG